MYLDYFKVFIKLNRRAHCQQIFAIPSLIRFTKEFESRLSDRIYFLGRVVLLCVKTNGTR